MGSVQDDPSQPSVAILMGTFNGAAYLSQQLESLEQQTHRNWVLYVSDDGSSDGTLALLGDYQRRWGDRRLFIRQGPSKGFATNFMALAADPTIRADWYAFCDQDDVWLPSKLKIAIGKLEAELNSVNRPALYGACTFYVEDDLKPYRTSPFFRRPKTFRNALVQSIAGGNTMVFNRSFKEVIEKVGAVNAQSHDWWLYQLITGIGGFFYFDPVPQVFYRQHANALVGEKKSLGARFKRFSLVMGGRFREWADQNIGCLDAAYPLLTPLSREDLKTFKELRQATLFERVRLFRKGGFYRQTRVDSLSLLIAVILKKL